MNHERILVVAAHPDDEILGCGGTMALLSRRAEVRIFIVGEGITSRVGVTPDEATKQLADLRDDARRAAQRVGADVSFAGLPDNRLDTVPLLEIGQLIEEQVEAFKPGAIFTHFPGDLNVDHRQVFNAVMIAARPPSAPAIAEIHCFEVLSSTEWAFGRINGAFNPQTFYDISSTVEAKVEAMLEYRSERRSFPHPRSSESIRAAATRWGTVVGVSAAEAFVTVRQIRRS